MKKLVLLAMFSMFLLCEGQVVPLIGGPYPKDANGNIDYAHVGREGWMDSVRRKVKELEEHQATLGPLSTGRYRTVKGSFMTIYSPNCYSGRVFQREMLLHGVPYWEEVGYSRRKLLFFRKNYNMWEVYYPR